jgi:hypothetical protein
MARRKNGSINIARATLIASVGAVFGWIIFTGLLDLFPQLSSLHPVVRIGAGILGIVLLTKFGLQK